MYYFSTADTIHPRAPTQPKPTSRCKILKIKTPIPGSMATGGIILTTMGTMGAGPPLGMGTVTQLPTSAAATHRLASSQMKWIPAGLQPSLGTIAVTHQEVQWTCQQTQHWYTLSVGPVPKWIPMGPVLIWHHGCQEGQLWGWSQVHRFTQTLFLL